MDGNVDLSAKKLENIVQLFKQKESLYEDRIATLEKERDALNAETLIKSQI